MTTIPRKRRFFPKPKRLKSDMNITPLIDVLLVLLVIFMVITPQTPYGLDTNVPQPSPPGPEQKRPETLVLNLSRTGTIHLNQEEVDSAVLAGRLQEVFATRSDRTIFVQADNDLQYDEVTHLIDVARGAGALRVGLLTAPLAH